MVLGRVVSGFGDAPACNNKSHPPFPGHSSPSIEQQEKEASPPNQPQIPKPSNTNKSSSSDEEGFVAVGAGLRRGRRVVGLLPPGVLRRQRHRHAHLVVAPSPPPSAHQGLRHRRGERRHGHRADHPDARPRRRDRAGGRRARQAPRGDAGPAARGGVPPTHPPRLRHGSGRHRRVRPRHRHRGGAPDPGGDPPRPPPAERRAVPEDRAAAGGALARGADPRRLQPRRRPHLRRVEALGVPGQPRHRVRHQPRLVKVQVPPRRAPRRQRAGCAGVHGGGARRQLGGGVVERQRGGDAGAQVAAGEPPLLRRGGARGHPPLRRRQRLRGDQPQGIHLLGHRLLRGQPRRLAPPRPAPHPPGLRPRHRLPRHRQRRLPQPARQARPRRRARRRRDGAHRGGGQEAPPLRQDALGELPAARTLIHLVLCSNKGQLVAL